MRASLVFVLLIEQMWEGPEGIRAADAVARPECSVNYGIGVIDRSNWRVGEGPTGSSDGIVTKDS